MLRSFDDFTYVLSGVIGALARHKYPWIAIYCFRHLTTGRISIDRTLGETIQMSFYRSSTICNKTLAIAPTHHHKNVISLSEALPWVTKISISSVDIKFMDSNQKLFDSILSCCNWMFRCAFHASQWSRYIRLTCVIAERFDEGEYNKAHVMRYIRFR